MFTEKEAKNVAHILNVKFTDFTFEDFLFAMNKELVHGTNYESTNVTNDNPIITAKIALAHLNIYPNYYNQEYGITYFEKTLKEKLAEEQKIDVPTYDDVKEKEC